MKKKILLTGASGFSGKSLFKFLIKKNFSITTLSFKKKLNKYSKKIDLSKKIRINSNFDWIIHTAAYHKIKDFNHNPKLKAKKNILMVENLIDFSKRNKIHNIIFFSTIDLNYFPYPRKKRVYIKSKALCEKLLNTAFDKKILKKLVILRLPAIIGKGCNENFVKNTIQKLKKNMPVNIWNKDKKYNNIVHIKDLNKLIFNLISKKKYKQKILIDCLSSNSIRLSNLIIYLKNKIKSNSKIQFLRSRDRFKKIDHNSRFNYKFFSVKKAIGLLI